MIRQYLCISLVMIVGLVFIDMSDATVYYMGGPGDDFQNLAEAFNGPNAMQGGDTLIIRDGVYAGDANTILSGTVRQPPNGTPGNYTTIKAENLGGVIFTVPIKIVGPTTRNSYWEFEGIKWASYVNLYGNHHVKFLRCAFEGDVWDGNSVAFGTNSVHHLLLEDCIAYGKGRYKFLIYLSSEVILRRCVARQDYANRNIDSSMPIAVFSIYGSRNVECQNCISIDGDQPQYWHTSPTEFGGAFYAPGRGEARWRGCIALNMAMGGGSANDVDNPFENTIVWRAVTGLPDFRSSGTTFEHITIGNLVEPGEMGVVPSQVKFNGGTGIGVGRSITKVSNSIITDAYSVAINSTSLGGNVLYNNMANGNIIDTDTTDVNPLYDPIANPNGGLRYLARIEEGSSLKGTATDEGDIGANVLKRIGQSGTLYGELGYDEITEENLWPWPYEDWIKEQMGNYNRGGIDPQLPRGDRGFAAYQSPFGSPNTLTSYIWEYLGSQIPPEIYNVDPTPLGQPGKPQHIDE